MTEGVIVGVGRIRVGVRGGNEAAVDGSELGGAVVAFVPFSRDAHM